MKKIFIKLFLFLILGTHLHAVNPDQVKVAYTYNFLKHTIWPNESKLSEYNVLVVSKNESLKNMFLMLSSRKLLNNKKIKVSWYKGGALPKNIQAVYVDNDSILEYERIFYGYENNDVLLITDGYQDRKKVLINLVENKEMIVFEINKANILNRSLQISSDLILLGGTEIDVAKLYKSSQDELKEQKEAVVLLNKKIEEKNSELAAKISSIEKQKKQIEEQSGKIALQRESIDKQMRSITNFADTIYSQEKELSQIRESIAEQRLKLAVEEDKIRTKEAQVKILQNSYLQQQAEMDIAKKKLDSLNQEITRQQEKLSIKEGIITIQRSVIVFMAILIATIIVLVGYIIWQNRRLHDLARIDPLTGLFNRRAFKEEIDREMESYRRYGSPFSLLLIDVDHFKSVNDQYGHDQGDIVLKTIADLMRESTRKTDICVRWGGEEFMILARETDFNSALSLAQNFQKIIAEHSFEPIHSVTVSMGIVSASQDQSIENLIQAADSALYRAKNSGRNCIVY